MSWTHAICDDCWDKKNPDRPSPRSNVGEMELCCYCGKKTRSGIYVRGNPKDAPHCAKAPGEPA